MDADLSHDPADVPRLLEALDQADLAIGSRYVSGGRIENWGAARRSLSRLGNVYARFWLGNDVADWTSGFRAYRTLMLERLDLRSVRSQGYTFQIEMTRRVLRSGGVVVEIPIKFVERERGESKVSRRIVLEAVARVTNWAQRPFRAWWGRGAGRRTGFCGCAAWDDPAKRPQSSRRRCREARG